MRIIKRYANRKLYDTQDRRYVTLARLAERLKEGEEIQIIDNTSGKDVTAVALSQILTETERKKAGAVPTHYLTDLLRRGGGAITDAVRRSSTALTGAWDVAEDELEKRVKALVKAGEMPQKEAKRLLGAASKRAAANKKLIEKRVEDTVRATLSRIEIPTQKDLDDINARLDALTELIEAKVESRNGRKTRRQAPADLSDELEVRARQMLQARLCAKTRDTQASLERVRSPRRPVTADARDLGRAQGRDDPREPPRPRLLVAVEVRDQYRALDGCGCDEKIFGRRGVGDTVLGRLEQVQARLDDLVEDRPFVRVEAAEHQSGGRAIAELEEPRDRRGENEPVGLTHQTDRDGAADGATRHVEHAESREADVRGSKAVLFAADRDLDDLIEGDARALREHEPGLLADRHQRVVVVARRDHCDAGARGDRTGRFGGANDRRDRSFARRVDDAVVQLGRRHTKIDVRGSEDRDRLRRRPGPAQGHVVSTDQRPEDAVFGAEEEDVLRVEHRHRERLRLQARNQKSRPSLFDPLPGFRAARASKSCAQKSVGDERLLGEPAFRRPERTIRLGTVRALRERYEPRNGKPVVRPGRKATGLREDSRATEGAHLVRMSSPRLGPYRHRGRHVGGLPACVATGGSR